ncbi:SDR family oxidoreductase [Streptomyces cadmiisoli]|uniref:SDR family oxidoreductase n=1 Tax=Streptomyces cadmiisoli TaxID=2184053 RepID=UPI003657029D
MHGALREAVRGLTRVAAREWGAYGIRVDVVCPAVLSPAAEAHFADHSEEAEHAVGGVPLGRMCDSETDIGRATAAFVSDVTACLPVGTLMLQGAAG